MNPSTEVMTTDIFRLEEEDIVFESFLEEPELGTVEGSSSAEALCSAGSLERNDPVYLDGEPCFENIVTVDIDKLRQSGVPEYVIAMILENQMELSSLRITRSARILLPEYRLEIKMPPLDKALYFLFLRHPEGIRFKELCDYATELSCLYSSVSGRDDMGQIEASISSLIDPLNNSVNEKCSRIKRAFTKAFSKHLARYYYIDGKGGQPKSIALDRDLVFWDDVSF